MMTKDQEREVLRKIVELIGSTEDGSYIKTAFQGCVADAVENINNDFACSWYDRAQSAERKAAEAQAVAKDAREAYEALKATAAQKDKYIEYWKAEAEAAEAELARQEEQTAAELRKSEGRQQEYKAMLDDANKDFFEVQAEAEALRQEVIELKAKLYDFMTKG